MPRSSRIISPTGIYHITLRSVNHHIIFEEIHDYHKFLFILSDSKAKHDVKIYAYCLMDNHIHLLLYSPPTKLAPFFQSVGTRFVRWYNTKYNRCGHLFQERYHSRPVEGSQAFLNTLVYIHNNPVKAGMCRYPSEYRWSSYNAFYGAKNPLIDLSEVYQLVGSRDFLKKYFSSIEQTMDFENEYEKIDHPDTRHLLTDAQALAKFKSLTNLSSPHEVPLLGKSKRNEIARMLVSNGFTRKQISRLLDISIPTINRICR